MDKTKIYICGSVSAKNEEENIIELVKTFNFFTGAIFNVNYDRIEDCTVNNITYFLLDKYKKSGKIFLSPWIKRHDYSMNVFLKAGILRRGDAFMYLDAQELPKIEFLTGMHDLAKECIENGIGAVHWNRPYFIFYENEMQFVHNPHAWLYGICGKQINIANENQVKYDDDGVHFGDFIYNKKKKENSMLLSGVKYSLYDPPNNQFSMFYAGQQLIEHEQKRIEFCNLLDDLGYQRDLAGLEQFFRKKENLTDEIKQFLAFEWVFSDFYKYKILGFSLEETLKDRYNKINFNDKL